MPIRVKEAANILGVSPGTVRNCFNQGKLPYHLHGGRNHERKKDR